MSYFILCAIFAVWAFFDAGKRKNSRGWSIATLVLGPIVLPIYLAKRNLFEGETREGGYGWNVCKNFALFWTITLVVAGFAGLAGVSEEVAQQTQSSAEQAGAAIGAGLGLGMLAFLWFIGMVGALLIGMFLKKSSVVEHGPTGALAASTETTSNPDSQLEDPTQPS